MSNTLEIREIQYYACDNAGDDRHEDWCEQIIFAQDYSAKRSYLISTLAWDLGNQRPVCDPCEEFYNDIHSA